MIQIQSVIGIMSGIISGIIGSIMSGMMTASHEGRVELRCKVATGDHARGAAVGL